MYVQAGQDSDYRLVINGKKAGLLKQAFDPKKCYPDTHRNGIQHTSDNKNPQYLGIKLLPRRLIPDYSKNIHQHSRDKTSCQPHYFSLLPFRRYNNFFHTYIYYFLYFGRMELACSFTWVY